jgi:hypothetical protein
MNPEIKTIEAGSSLYVFMFSRLSFGSAANLCNNAITLAVHSEYLGPFFGTTHYVVLNETRATQCSRQQLRGRETVRAENARLPQSAKLTKCFRNGLGSAPVVAPGHKDLRMAARYQHLSPTFLADASCAAGYRVRTAGSDRNNSQSIEAQQPVLSGNQPPLSPARHQ